MQTCVMAVMSEANTMIEGSAYMSSQPACVTAWLRVCHNFALGFGSGGLVTTRA